MAKFPRDSSCHTMETSSKLFVRRDGRGMCFYLPPSVRDKDGTRSRVKDLVEKHGGRFRTPSLRVSQDDTVIQLVHVGDAGNEKALLAAEERGEKLYYCTYVLDSAAKGALLTLEGYEVQLPPASMAQKRSHYRWTPQEDNALLAYASKSILARRGDTFWEEAERQQVTQHTWQAMKERYNKHLAPAQKAKATISTPPGENLGIDSVAKPGPGPTPLPTPPATQPQKQTSASVLGKPASRSAAKPITPVVPSLKPHEGAGVEPKSKSTARVARAAAESEAGSSRVDPSAERHGDSQSEGGTARAAKTAESRTEGRLALSSLTEEHRGSKVPTNIAPAAAQSSRPASVTATPSEPLLDARPLSPTRQGQAPQPATSLIATPRTEVRTQANQIVQPQNPSSSGQRVAFPLPSQRKPHPNHQEQVEDAQTVPPPSVGNEGERLKSPVALQPLPLATVPSPPAVPGPQTKELPGSYLLKPVRGAAVLRASSKPAPVSRLVSASVGAAAAFQGRKAEADARQPAVSAEEAGQGGHPGIGEVGRGPLDAHLDPFTQEPAAGCAETAIDDWQETQEGPQALGKPAGPAESDNGRGAAPVRVPEGQGSRRLAGIDGRNRALGDSAALPATDAKNGKKQRVGPQQLVPTKKTAGSFSAVMLEGDAREESHGHGEGAARELREEPGTVGARLPAGDAKRKLDGRDDEKEALPSNIGVSEERRTERVDGTGVPGELTVAVSKAGRVASEGGEGQGQGEERAEALDVNAHQGKRRRLQKVTDEPAAGYKQPGGEKPVSSTQEASERKSVNLALARVSEIRSWVAKFMKEYGCSQDDVIKALINASGKFEAARPFLDARNRGNVREPGWGLREDHVLLMMPVAERHRHPAFDSLRQTFGDEAVERRLRFLGRLGPE